MFLDSASIHKDNLDRKLFFTLLRKKHYLALLKREYAGIIVGDKGSLPAKVSSYLEEIRKTAEELRTLNQHFALE
jgi:hypothetical protein